MFSTLAISEIEFPDVFGDIGKKHWSYIEYPLAMPYFHFMLDAADRHIDYCRKTHLLTSIEQLRQLAIDPDWVLSDVQLVSPGHINKSGGWKMDALESVLRGFDARGKYQQYAYVYVLMNGDRYVQSNLDASESEISDIHEYYVSSSPKN